MEQYYVFVYGTLRANERNHRLLSGASCLAKQAWTYGRLYDTGLGYPAMEVTFDSKVYGELYEVDGNQLQQLDWLEGYSEVGAANHYERVERPIYTDAGLFNAFVYVYDRGRCVGLEEIQFGDWKCHCYLKKESLLYFAYGSCMDDHRFCGAKIDRFFSTIKGCGVSSGYDLAYTRRSFDGGRADMIEADSWVEGKVYEIHTDALKYLFRREGVNSGIYRPAFIQVEVEGVVLENVLTFLVVEKEEETAPPMHYATEILRGGKGFVSEAYYQKLCNDLKGRFGLVITI